MQHFFVVPVQVRAVNMEDTRSDVKHKKIIRRMKTG